MAVRDVFKVSRKTFVDPKSWIDWDSITRQHSLIRRILTPLFTIPTPTREETYEQALERLDMTEDQADALSKRYYNFALLFIALFFIAFLYAFLLLIVFQAWIAWLVGLMVSTFFLAQAFRFHFWYYQLKIKHLGVTWSEWKDAIWRKKVT